MPTLKKILTQKTTKFANLRRLMTSCSSRYHHPTYYQIIVAHYRHSVWPLLHVCRMEIEKEASEQETNIFLQENRPVWPRVPTACLVKDCGEKLYSTFKDFLNHWKSVHEINKILKSCSCGKLFTTA